MATALSRNFYLVFGEQKLADFARPCKQLSDRWAFGQAEADF
jgi:hypothetical protein